MPSLRQARLSGLVDRRDVFAGDRKAFALQISSVQPRFAGPLLSRCESLSPLPGLICRDFACCYRRFLREVVSSAQGGGERSPGISLEAVEAGTVQRWL